MKRRVPLFVKIDSFIQTISENLPIEMCNPPKYNKIVAEYLGKGKKVNECDESQLYMMLLILDDLNDYVKANNIEV